MDIVQYLHGLVSSSMGISNEDTSADLLKQYYALSVARLIELDGDFDINNVRKHHLVGLWENQALFLTQRLSRSFHMDEQQTITLLKAITPPMMTELANLAGGVGLVPFLATNFASSHTHLPAWSSQFIGPTFAQKLTQANTKTDTNPTDDTPHQMDDVAETSPIVSLTKADPNEVIRPTTGNDENPSDDIQNLANYVATPKPTKPKASRPASLMMGLGVGLLALAVGGGAWYFLNKKSEPVMSVADDPNVAKPTVENLNPPRLSITSGENNTLYACQAEVGNNELQATLLGILQKNFGQIGCIMDIDDNFGTSLIGLERLESIMAMVKSEPFTSIEIIGGHIYVNTPKAEVLPRLVNDIALLAPQFKVSPAPALDKPTTINQSLEKATTALNNLSNPANDYDLSRAMSLAIIDFNGTSDVPTNTQGVLTLVADKLKANPSIKLIIATHTSGGDGTDRMANLTLSQTQAQSIKTFLVKNGVSDNQLTAKGVGDAFPVADNITELGKFKNARTEFLVFDEATMSALNVDMTQMIAPPPVNAPTQTIQVPVQTMQIPADGLPIQAVPMPVQGMPPVPVQPMPVQGMPDGNYQPQSVEQPIIVQVSPPQGYISSSPPTSPPPPANNLPDDFVELSNATISSEQGQGGEHEIR